MSENKESDNKSLHSKVRLFEDWIDRDDLRPVTQMPIAGDA